MNKKDESVSKLEMTVYKLETNLKDASQTIKKMTVDLRVAENEKKDLIDKIKELEMKKNQI